MRRQFAIMANSADWAMRGFEILQSCAESRASALQFVLSTADVVVSYTLKPARPFRELKRSIELEFTSEHAFSHMALPACFSSEHQVWKPELAPIRGRSRAASADHPHPGLESMR